MTTTTTARDADEVKTWRDFADRLTEDRVRQLEGWATDSRCDPDTLHAAAERMLAETEAQRRYAHIPLPLGATQAEAWEDDEGWSRVFQGTAKRVGDHCVGVYGTQWSDGRVEASPAITAPTDPKEELTVVEALEIAVALTAAVQEVNNMGIYAQAAAVCAARKAAFADTPLPRGIVEVAGYASIDPLVRGCVLTNYDPPVGSSIFGNVDQHTDGTVAGMVVYDTGDGHPNSGEWVEMTPQQAREIAAQLLAAADDVDNCGVVAS